jgi:hypothetical protein
VVVVGSSVAAAEQCVPDRSSKRKCVESILAQINQTRARVRWKRGYRLKIDIAIVPAVSGMVATVIVLCETRARRAEKRGYRLARQR